MKQKTLRWILAITAVLAVATGVIVGTSLRRESTPTPSGIHDVTLPDLDGRARSFSEWKGKTLVVNFWATWCAPCREEIPLLKAAQERYSARGLQIVGVAIDDIADVLAYNRSMVINYPTLVADLSTLSLMAQYGNSTGGLPYTLLFDANGRMISQKLGAYRHDELHRAIESALTSATNKP